MMHRFVKEMRDEMRIAKYLDEVCSLMGQPRWPTMD